MNERDSSPAFPQITGETYTYTGMTLRDYFAAAALQGFFAAPNEALPKGTDFPVFQQKTVALFYQWADAMLAERCK